jgi:hypothetical protein
VLGNMMGAYLMTLMRRTEGSMAPRPAVTWRASARAFKRQPFVGVEPGREKTAARVHVNLSRGESRRNNDTKEAPPLHAAVPPRAKERVDIHTSEALFEGEEHLTQPPTARRPTVPPMHEEVNTYFARTRVQETDTQPERIPARRPQAVSVNATRDSTVEPSPVDPSRLSIVHLDEMERWVETPAAPEPASEAVVEAPERFVVRLTDDCPALDTRARIEVERSVVAAARSAVKSSRDAPKDLREQTIEVRVERVDVKLEAPPPSPAHVAPTPNAASGLSAFFLSRSVSGW